MIDEYPKYNHYLIFNRISRDEYHIKNFWTEEEWSVSVFFARFLKRLDGKTDPYSIYHSQISKDDIDSILEQMEEEGFLDDPKGIVLLGEGTAFIPLWIPKITKRHRFFGAIWNKLLSIVWLPFFIIGVYVLCSFDWEWVSTGYSILKGNFLGFGLGLLLHELSHAFACIGLHPKNYFFEMGVAMHHFLPGAYVMIDYSEMKDRLKRAQINAAGVECNMALCGIFLCSLKFGVFDSGTLIIATVINFILAVFNITLINGMDGMGIFREIFASSDDFVERAKKVVWDRESKKTLCRKDINGRATIVACYIIVAMQILLPLVIIMNIVSTVSAFME